MNRRSKTARLLTGGLVGASTAPLPGDEHWDSVTLLLDGTSATTDVSGNNNLTNNGATISTATGPFTGTHIEFGGSDYLNATSGTGSNHMLGTGDWTVETWVRFDNFTDSWCRVWEFGPYNASGGFRLNQSNQTGQMVIQSYSTDATDSTPLSTNTWYHLAVTRSGNTFTLYRDGQQVAQFTHTGYTLNATAFRIGAGQINATDTGTNNFITGDIADFRITKGVARYTSNFTPPTQKFLPFATRPYSGTFGLGDEHWDDVVLLLNAEASPIVDESSNSASTNIAVGSGVTRNTSHKQFGNASVEFTSASADAYDSIKVYIPALDGDYTIEFWIKGKATDLSNGFVFDTRTTANSTGISLLFPPAGTPNTNKLSYWNSSGTYRILSGVGAISTSSFDHVALVRSGAVVTLYLNGSSLGTDNEGTAISWPAATWTIGTRHAGTANGWSGLNAYIDDFRITKGVARYTANFTPPAASFPTNAPVVGRRGVGTEATLRTRGYVGAAPAGSGGMLTLYDRFVPQRWDGLGAEFLLVGGGATGGRGPGPGGGGAGGMVVGTNQTFSLSTPYSIVIGKGGDHLAQGIEDDGDPSTFEGYLASNFQSLDAEGGGRGRQVVFNTASPGAPGGSGGGGSGGFEQGPLAGGSKTQATYSGLTGIAGHGNEGGTSADWYPNNEYYGAGGGGAGSAGQNANNSNRKAGDGGDGRQWAVDGQYYAGGGGGSAFDDWPNGATLTASSRGSGGLGGGGAGAWRPYSGSVLASVAGSPNTGGGGGGGSPNGQGGSGVCKIWVPVANYTNYVVGAELTEAASQQVTYGGTTGTLITITASSGTTANTILFN